MGGGGGMMGYILNVISECCTSESIQCNIKRKDNRVLLCFQYIM